MKRIRLSDVGLDHCWTAWKLTQLLRKQYDVEMVDPHDTTSPPDLSLHAVTHHFLPLSGSLPENRCLRASITNENIRPDFRLFDYSFSFEKTDERNFQLPSFCGSVFFEAFRTGRYGNEVQRFRKRPKDRFCNFVYSHTKSRQRLDMLKKLMAYRKVDCPGKACNNMPPIGHSHRDKLAFISSHKFTIAFENRSAPDYVTEKIYDALLVNSIPVYWGCPRIAEYFNPESFINCHDYDSLDRAVARVIEVDKNDALYQRHINAPPVLDGSRAHLASEHSICQRLERIVNSIGTRKPVGTTAAYRFRLALYKAGVEASGLAYLARKAYPAWAAYLKNRGAS